MNFSPSAKFRNATQRFAAKDKELKISRIQLNGFSKVILRRVPSAHAPFHEGHITENISAIWHTFTRRCISVQRAGEIVQDLIAITPLSQPCFTQFRLQRGSRDPQPP